MTVSILAARSGWLLWRQHWRLTCLCEIYKKPLCASVRAPASSSNSKPPLYNSHPTNKHLLDHQLIATIHPPMISGRVATRGSIASGRTTTQLLKSFNASMTRPTFVAVQHVHLAPASQRHLSSSQSSKIQKFFERKETDLVRKTPAAWPHPGKWQQFEYI